MSLPYSILGALVVGFSAGLASLAALWLVDFLTAHFARTETDELDDRTRAEWPQAQSALRHPSFHPDAKDGA